MPLSLNTDSEIDLEYGSQVWDITGNVVKSVCQ